MICFRASAAFSLGLERTGGFETKAFCEIEEYPRRVLEKHWPGVPIYHDVRELTADTLRRDGIAVDVICGGFPCQDISFAGAGAGLEGERSGLWREYARLIGELRPRFVIVENVAALLGRGLGSVLGDLAALRYDALWDCVPASALGAPHQRDRVWIVAYADRCGGQARKSTAAALGYGRATGADGCAMADATDDRPGRREQFESGRQGPRHVANTAIDGRKSRRTRNAEKKPRGRQSDRSCERADIRHANVSGLALGEGQSRDVGEKLAAPFRADWWLSEPDVGRVAHGVPARVDRLKGLGNAVVPQIPEMIGRAILEANSVREKITS